LGPGATPAFPFAMAWPFFNSIASLLFELAARFRVA
jgi:hypothetical protein